jgi:hypothetical protein
MTRIEAKRLKYSTLTFRDKTHHLTPRATKSGYEHTQTKLLARTVARKFHLMEVHKDMGNKQIWRRGGDLNPRFHGTLVLQGNLTLSSIYARALRFLERSLTKSGEVLRSPKSGEKQ